MGMASLADLQAAASKAAPHHTIDLRGKALRGVVDGHIHICVPGVRLVNGYLELQGDSQVSECASVCCSVAPWLFPWPVRSINTKRRILKTAKQPGSYA